MIFALRSDKAREHAVVLIRLSYLQWTDNVSYTVGLHVKTNKNLDVADMAAQCDFSLSSVRYLLNAFFSQPPKERIR